MNREAVRLAQTPAYDTVHASDGVYAGLVWPSGRWECAECLTDGVDGRYGLLVHVGARHGAGAA